VRLRLAINAGDSGFSVFLPLWPLHWVPAVLFIQPTLTQGLFGNHHRTGRIRSPVVFETHQRAPLTDRITIRIPPMFSGLTTVGVAACIGFKTRTSTDARTGSHTSRPFIGSDPEWDFGTAGLNRHFP